MSQTTDALQQLRNLVRTKRRFTLEAYLFLREALDYAQKLVGEKRHVSGTELLEGFRQLAIDSFGPLCHVVFKEWGVQSTAHVGEMVFDLVDCELLSKTEDDRMDDFVGVYDFEQEFAPERLFARLDASFVAAPARATARELSGREHSAIV
ncbi:MAG: hypothetical protein KDD82_15790 [Planctomycetes bacterium]|nr:hypothetical protein [Planctomycetota bacterium]